MIKLGLTTKAPRHKETPRRPQSRILYSGLLGVSLCLGAFVVNSSLQAQGRGRPGASPASQAPPQTLTQQVYPADQVQAGRPLFTAQCGFCHGRDAAGGETGPDLTRSTLVAADARGDKIGPVVRSGRADKGMPSFSVSDSD